jgi:hypothetical protein
MASIDRRTFLGSVGTAAAGLPALRGHVRAHRTDLEALALRLRGAERERAFDIAVEAVRAGASWHDVLGAVLLAGVRDVRPHPVGFRFHCVLMVPAALQLADATDTASQPLPILYNLDDFKRAQADDVRTGDWTMPPPAEAGDRPARDLERGLEEWDEPAVDRALAVLARASGRDALFELLWPFAARDFGSIGHKMIFAAGAHRVLGTFGWEHAQPVLRSLGSAMLDGGAGPSSAPFTHNRRRVEEFPARWREGKRDPQASAGLLRGLRSADTDGAVELTIEALARAVAPESVWDGFRLAAAEQLLQRPGILAVHAMTSIQALHYGFEATRNDATARLMLLQAAAWLVMFRDAFAQRAPTSNALPLLDELEPAPAAKTVPAEVFAAASGDRRAAAGLALGLLRAGDPARSAAFAEALRQQVFTRAGEHHQYKYAAAVLDEVARTDPQWAPHLLAAGIGYLPAAGPPAEVHDRARASLRALER